MPSSPDEAISTSSDRLISRAPAVSPSDDDTRRRPPYRSSMRFRLDSERLDLVLAALLFVGAEV